jgi:superoxide dismutase, Fe-Mn family
VAQALYYLKYQNHRADYRKAWRNVVDWKDVEQRFDKFPRRTI